MAIFFFSQFLSTGMKLEILVLGSVECRFQDLDISGGRITMNFDLN